MLESTLTHGRTKQWGTAKRTNGMTVGTGKDSLIATWRSPTAGRLFYDTCQSTELDNKLRATNLGPKMLPFLEACDTDGTGLITQASFTKVLMTRFNVLLTPGELDCLKAEWQVMDHLTLMVDYASFCVLATPEYLPGATTTDLGETTEDLVPEERTQTAA